MSRILFLSLIPLVAAGGDADVLLQVQASAEAISAPLKKTDAELKVWSGNKLVNRIANALKPRIQAKNCDDFYEQGHGGAFYRWCNKVLKAAVKHNKTDPQLLGLSYGIFTWDPWSRYLANDFGIKSKLYDCYATKPLQGVHDKYKVQYERFPVCVSGTNFVDKDGRKFEAFQDHLKDRPARGTLVKMDVEGAEWETLKKVSDEDLKKIDLLDMEIHFCKHMDGLSPAQRRAEVADRVNTLERLTHIFHVAGRDPAAPTDPDFTAYNLKQNKGRDGQYSNRTDFDICGDHAYPGPKGGHPHGAMLSVSYVNRERLSDKM